MLRPVKPQRKVMGDPNIHDSNIGTNIWQYLIEALSTADPAFKLYSGGDRHDEQRRGHHDPTTAGQR